MQYLNFAKKQRSSNPGQGGKSSSKASLMNVNLKMINYDHGILEKLAGNRNRVENVEDQVHEPKQ
jgi:hypothetical protein